MKEDNFGKPDDVLTAAEKYIEENGPEAFERLIARHGWSVDHSPKPMSTLRAFGLPPYGDARRIDAWVDRGHDRSEGDGRVFEHTRVCDVVHGPSPPPATTYTATYRRRTHPTTDNRRLHCPADHLRHPPRRARLKFQLNLHQLRPLSLHTQTQIHIVPSNTVDRHPTQPGSAIPRLLRRPQTPSPHLALIRGHSARQKIASCPLPSPIKAAAGNRVFSSAHRPQNSDYCSNQRRLLPLEAEIRPPMEKLTDAAVDLS
ncbi:glutathione-regulated potassium-efflux system protein [Striga asiatica]|uniref:Glutathione-regulated potassium-efflux system protein n=1 Tax=Striga asiatica TaxID=4170 RepID=A0A5A7QWT1_STRAF|nr:glutathione-regulated potassium-efflux system protein [Striga asiatica]